MLNEIINEINKMSVSEFAGYIVLIAGIISAIIEKSKKLPFNPWSSLLKWIGSIANESIIQRMNALEENQKETKEYIGEIRNDHQKAITEIKEDYNGRIDALERNADEKEAKRLRSNIICFSDACRIGTQHTKQHFENIFRDYDDYERYCKKHNFENHYIEGEMKYIKDVYAECLKDNKFL